jgi:hypothetical protein
MKNVPRATSGLAALALLSLPATLSAQDDAESLAARSAIVVAGKVVKANASEEPLVAASSRTAVISVQRMYAGSEIAGDQKGRTMTVILSRPDRLKVGEEALFFGNPRLLGRTLTIADEGELSAKEAPPGALERGVQARRDQPLRERLARASLVFRGSVEEVRPLAAPQEAVRTAPRSRSEHDPEWQVATMRVAVALRGESAGQAVAVVFPGSRDITWHNVAKLKRGQEAVVIAHAPDKEEQALYRGSGLAAYLEKEQAWLVTEPFDVLAVSEEARVRALLEAPKEAK